MRTGTDGVSQLDLGALGAEPTARELRTFAREIARPPRYPSGWVRTSGVVGRIVLYSVLIGLLGIVVILALVIAIVGPPTNRPAALVTALVIGGATITPLAFFIRRAGRSIRPLKRWYRLHHFAAANGLDFTAEIPKPGLPGFAFRLDGQDRVITDLFRLGGERPVEFGNYRAEVGTTPPRLLQIGFIRMRLDHPMPHLVLLGGGGLTRAASDPITGVFARSQAVSLEGDFGRHFRVFAPDGYGADVRFVLTPDLMAALIDGAQGFDVEMVDSDLYLYAAAPFDFEQDVAYARIAHVVDTVASRALRRAGRFTDDRSADPQSGAVAPAGRRMRWAFPITGIVIIGGYLTWRLLQLFTPL